MLSERTHLSGFPDLLSFQMKIRYRGVGKCAGGEASYDATRPRPFQRPKIWARPPGPSFLRTLPVPIQSFVEDIRAHGVPLRHFRAREFGV